ncbi:MAG: hypothetical protein Q4C47_02035, partial [Planctomycetia bacterium]|nr:hypothetical protein [Planctomycetia bacterium]
SLDLNKIAAMAEVGPFVRARQSFCQGAKVIPQVTLLCPTESHYRRVSDQGSALFPWSVSWQRGVLQCLLECGYPVSIVTEQKFVDDPSRYPVIVVCEWEWLSPETVEALSGYAGNGGKLFVIGKRTAELLPVNTTVYAECMTDAYRGGDPAANTKIRRRFRTILDEIYSRPVVVLENGTDEVVPVDLSLMRTADGKLAVHLTNVSGDHAGKGIIREIAPVKDVKLVLRCGEGISRLVLEPGGRPLEFVRDEMKNTVRVTIPEVSIHEILVVE